MVLALALHSIQFISGRIIWRDFWSSLLRSPSRCGGQHQNAPPKRSYKLLSSPKGGTARVTRAGGGVTQLVGMDPTRRLSAADLPLTREEERRHSLCRERALLER
jgi:hypothetical protein